MRIEEIKNRYKDEWVLLEILEENKQGKPEKVKLIEHSKDRSKTYRAMNKYAQKYTYHFYTGEIPKKNYAVAF